MIVFRCDQAVGCGADALDERHGLLRRLQLRAHLLFCRDCRRYLDQLRHTVSALRHLGAEPVQLAGRDALLERLQARRRPSNPPE